jgi:hypothetical protein
LIFDTMDGRGSSERTPGSMKAVAAALVLIAGAAVVLWYGNTLNSWVLGGLIGGLAALLLSIPISLTLFAYLSRRHDERLKAEAEASQMQVYEYPAASSRMARRTYEVQGYALPHDQSLSDEEIYEAYYRQRNYHHTHTAARHLPIPSAQRLPVQSQSSDRLPVTRRGTPGTRVSSRQLPSNVPLVEQRDPVSKRTTPRRLNYPGFPGYASEAAHSKQRSAALRAARQEAVQHDDDVDVLPTHFSQPLSSSRRLSQPLAGQTDRLRRSSQPLDDEERAPRRTRSRRTVDSVPSQSGLSRSLPPAVGSTAHDDLSVSAEPHTDYLYEADYAQIEQMGQFARTDQLVGQPQLDGRASTDRDVTTGNLSKSLVRRAPYLYADDALRRELAQQIDGPVVRRSSRLEAHQRDDDRDDYK